MIVGRQGRALSSRWTLAAVALCVVATSPNVIWQWQHGWPILDVLVQDARNRHPLANGVAFESANVWLNALLFALMQFVYLNPVLSVVWVWGLLWLLVARDAAPFRFLAIAYLLLFVVMVALTARGYYLAGYYPVLFAAGGVGIERATALRVRWRDPITIVGALLATLMLPFALPILPAEGLIAYGATLGLGRPAPPDRRAHLVQPMFADEFGWDAMTQTVAAAYHALPPAQRADTGVFADGYAYAGALNFYGPRYGLPTAISGNNSYYLWGPGNISGASLLAVGATDYPLYQKLFVSVQQVAVFHDTYRWMIEGPLPVYLCTRPRVSLDKMWLAFKRYGL
jgi:uncharacterized membrane protein